MPTAAMTSRRREARHTLAAELSKLWSQPAVWLTLIGAWGVHLLLTAAFIQAEARSPGGEAQDWLDVGLAALSYAQAGFIVLGVLAACSEYNGGQIRTTLLAMPRRGRQLLAARLALALLAVPAAVIVAASGIGAAAVALADAAPPAAAGRLAAALAGAAGSLALTTLIAAAVGTLLRRTLSATAVLLGLYFVAGPIVRGQATLAQYLPDAAADAMWQRPTAHSLSPIQAALCLSLWALAALVLAAIVHRRRDV